MSVEAKQLQPDTQSFDNRLLVMVFICSLIAQGMRGIKWLPYGIALPLVYYFVLLIGYWVGRRPSFAFGPFALRLTISVIIGLAGLWAIPELLCFWIWRPLAYAAPVLILAILIYWMPPLYSSQKKRGRLWVWLLISLGFAVFYGWSIESGR